MSVKKYTYRYADDGELYRHEEPDGEFVLSADYAELQARYNALKEAVAWERECRVTRNTMRIWHVWPAQDEAQRSYIAARVEVDRLLGEK